MILWFAYFRCHSRGPKEIGLSFRTIFIPSFSVLRTKTINTKQGHVIEYSELNAGKAKATIDEIDLMLGHAYGFSDSQIDYVINYDAKYRLGDSVGDEDD